MTKTKLLNDTQSAIYLGISKELLFAYIRNAPKKNKGDNRKLISQFIDGQNYFEKQELDDFDSYLKKPWSDSGAQRPPIPAYIKDYLKVEVNGRCPITGEGYPLEDAHIVPYSEGLNHHHHNIIRISGNVHSKIDNRIVPREILWETKTRLIEDLRRKTLGNTSSLLNVPLSHPIYIGREGQLDELTTAMKFDRLIVIEGIGGIGKTELLIQALNKVTYYNTVIWIDMESIKNFSDFIVLFKNLIFKNFNIIFSENGLESIKEIKATFIFDSIENLLEKDSDEIQDFLNNLISCTINLQLLITSQLDLSLLDYPAKIFKITGLNSQESVILVYKLLDNSVFVPESDLEWVLDFCNGHPLSLKLFTSIIKYYQSSEKTILSIKNSQSLEIPNRNNHNKRTSLYTCLSVAYSLLSEEQNDFMHYLKFYPAGLKALWAQEKFEEYSFYKISAELKKLFFIETEIDLLNIERLVIPNPIRPFLEESLLKDELVFKKNIQIEKDAITDIMIGAVIVDLQHIERNVNNDLSYGIQRIEDELPNLLLALNIAKKRAVCFERLKKKKEVNEYLNIIGGLASALGKFCHTRSYYKEGVLFATSGIEAYIKLKDYSLAATQYMYLAQIQSRLHDIDELQSTVKKLEKLSEITENTEVKINTTWAKGLLNFDICMYKEARENFITAANYLENSIEEYKEIYNNNNNNDDDDNQTNLRSNYGNLFLLKSNIAKTHEFQGEYSLAISFYEEIIENLLIIASEDDIASIYHHYAHCLCNNGDMKTGLNHYFKSIEIFAKIGHYEYLANSISDLGQFVSMNPEIASHDQLDEEVFSLALNSINNQLYQISGLKENINLNPNIIPFSIISKMFWMFKVLSFSKYSYLFSLWVQDLRETYQIDFSKPTYLTAIFSLGHSAGQLDNWKGNSNLESIFIKSILKCCLLVNGGPDLKSKTKIFYWLETWMKFTELNVDATAENLWEQACRSFEN